MSSPKKRKSRPLTEKVAWTRSRTRRQPRSKSLPRSTSSRCFANSRSQSPNRARRSRPRHITETENRIGAEADTNPRGPAHHRTDTGTVRTEMWTWTRTGDARTWTATTSRWSCPSSRPWTSARIARTAITPVGQTATPRWTSNILRTKGITIRHRWRACRRTSIHPRP